MAFAVPVVKTNYDLYQLHHGRATATQKNAKLTKSNHSVGKLAQLNERSSKSEMHIGPRSRSRSTSDPEKMKHLHITNLLSTHKPVPKVCAEAERRAQNKVNSQSTTVCDPKPESTSPKSIFKSRKGPLFKFPSKPPKIGLLEPPEPSSLGPSRKRSMSLSSVLNPPMTRNLSVIHEDAESAGNSIGSILTKDNNSSNSSQHRLTSENIATRKRSFTMLSNPELIKIIQAATSKAELEESHGDKLPEQQSDTTPQETGYQRHRRAKNFRKQLAVVLSMMTSRN